MFLSTEGLGEYYWYSLYLCLQAAYWQLMLFVTGLYGVLSECEASFVVHFEDLLDGVDIGCSTKVKSKVVSHGCAHDGL